MATAKKTKYDQKQARATEQAYRTPEITAQRMRTLQALALREGESVLDVGIGPGLLSYDMAQQVGAAGRVVGVDIASAMIDIARERLSGLSQAEVVECDATQLQFQAASFDAAACTQVLLYVSNPAKALAEIHRVLKPGGRVVVIETDWRGLVLSSSFSATTEKMIQNWDAAVASPQLPCALGPMLREAGFGAVAVSAVPVLATSCLPGGYAHSMLTQFRKSALEQNRLDDGEAETWFDDLMRRNREGGFFFCINRFQFTAARV